MKNLAQKFPLKKVLIKLGVLLLVLIFLAFFASWFYSSKFLLENKTASFVRRRMDYALHYAYLDNKLGFRSFVTLMDPTMRVWRPSRIVSDMVLPGSWDGTTEFNTIFAEVVEWVPEEGVLGVFPYANVYYDELFYVDLNTAKIIIPEFDEVSQPLPVPPVDDTFATDEEWEDFYNSFETYDEAYEFMSKFENDAALTSYVATNFGGWDPRIQFWGFDGPFEWESAFCLEDIVILAFDKSVDLTKPVENGDPEAKVVVVDLSSCPTDVSDGTEEVTQ